MDHGSFDQDHLVGGGGSKSSAFMEIQAAAAAAAAGGLGPPPPPPHVSVSSAGYAGIRSSYPVSQVSQHHDGTVGGGGVMHGGGGGFGMSAAAAGRSAAALAPYHFPMNAHNASPYGTHPAAHPYLGAYQTSCPSPPRDGTYTHLTPVFSFIHI